MKFLFSLFSTLLFINHYPLHAQTGPGGLGNSASNVLWLPVEGNTYTDAGITPGTSNANIQQWNDLSGNGHHAIQTNNVFQPNLNTNALNGYSTLTFNGTTDRMLSTGVTTSNQVTIFVVVRFNNLINNNDGIIQASPAGNAFSSTTSEKSIGMWINTTNGRLWGRAVQSNNTTRDIPQILALTTNQFYIIAQDMDGSAITQYVDGLIAGSVTYNNTLRDWSDFGIGRQANESLAGDIAEIVVYGFHLNDAQRIIAQNYLAAKYGLTLAANDVFDEDNAGSGNYDHEVAGIGRTDAANIHSDSKGSGMVRILNPTGLGDGEFLLWGHNNGIGQATNITDVPAGVVARFDRVWRVSERNATNTADVNVGNIHMRWDLNGIGTVTASDLRLLIDDDNDGQFNDETPISGAVDLGGGIYEFQAVPGGAGGIRNNRRFTLGTINPNNTPLPVTLAYFEALPIYQHKIRLTWATTAELNNDYFTIERSVDANNWELVQTVKGAGNSNTLLSYMLVDGAPHQGLSYYRLTQTDFDGNSEIQGVVSVQLTSTGNRELHIFPNPAEDIITIKAGKEALAALKICNTLGQDITSSVKILSRNEFTVTLDISQVPAGMFFISTGNAVGKVYKQ